MPDKSNKSVERSFTRRQISRWEEEQRRSKIITIAVSAVILVVLVLVSVVVIDSMSDDADSTTVLKVNDKSFDMDDYVKALNLYGIRNASSDELTQTAQDILSAMEDREIMRQLASTLGVEVTDEEIDAKIEEVFPAPEPDEDGNLPEYSDYEITIKRLERIGISEKDYRQAIASDILGQKVSEFIGNRDVPEAMAQAHIEAIMVNTEVETPQQTAEDVNVEVEGNPDAEATASIQTETENADTAAVTEETMGIQSIVAQIKARLADGEDFASLAHEFSTDPSSSTKGGDLGWIPATISETYYSGRYNEEFEKAAFDLDIGTLSNPIALSDSETNTRYWLIDPIERNDARVLDDDMRTIFENQAFSDWYTEQKGTFVIENETDSNPDLINEALQEVFS